MSGTAGPGQVTRVERACWRHLKISFKLELLSRVQKFLECQNILYNLLLYNSLDRLHAFWAPLHNLYAGSKKNLQSSEDAYTGNAQFEKVWAG